MLAVVNNFNLLDWPRAIAEWLARAPGLDVVILDNASTYEPLLAWYDTRPVEVIRLNRNVGCRAPWDTGLVEQRKGTEPYIVTDPDLDLSGIPSDWLDVLRRGIEYDGITKCGFSLALADLPQDAPQWQWVVATQADCWLTFDRDPRYCLAGIDTTFAMYRNNAMRRPRTTNLRAKPPYTARHLPWYLLPTQVPVDYQHFLRYASTVRSVGSTLTRELGQALIGQKPA